MHVKHSDDVVAVFASFQVADELMVLVFLSLLKWRLRNFGLEVEALKF